MNFSYIREIGDVKDHSTKNELVILLPVGCYWSKKNGSCSYCGYQSIVDNIQEKYGPVDLLAITQHEWELQSKIHHIHRIAFFVGGSFLEIPRDVRMSIIQFVSKLNIEEVFFETRPELVTKNNIAEIKLALGQIRLWIAIGLESADDYIRNVIHRKGFEKIEFEKAVKYCREGGAFPFAYIFVKPPIAGITDREAYDDAIKSIQYIKKVGVLGAELECGYIVKDTPMHTMYVNGDYVLLRLWTIIQIILDASDLTTGFVRLAYFSDTPEPVAIPVNCEKCSSRIYNALDEYRKHLDINTLKQLESCSCYTDWEKAFYSTPMTNANDESIE